MKARSDLLAIIMSAVLGTVWLPSATAQLPEAPLLQASPEYSDKELKSFAAAAIEVQRINDFYLPKLQAARNEKEELDVQRAASGEMTQAVESKGMTVDKFNEIMVVAQLNPQVAGKIVRHINEQR
jgi:hypothetical protein